ncbi:MAG: hypothetical protein LUI07_08875 [Lachnospiraceae bacterium]|nr:hypothetical protein [Lachnospiraceae bacterium]
MRVETERGALTVTVIRAVTEQIRGIGFATVFMYTGASGSIMRMFWLKADVGGSGYVKKKN